MTFFHNYSYLPVTSMISLLRGELAEEVSRTEFPRKVPSVDFPARIIALPTHTGQELICTQLYLLTCKSMRANQWGVSCLHERIGA